MAVLKERGAMHSMLRNIGSRQPGLHETALTPGKRTGRILLPAKLESILLAFGRVRRWLVAGFGVVVATRGLVGEDWLSLSLGAAIIAYGMFAPT